MGVAGRLAISEKTEGGRCVHFGKIDIKHQLGEGLAGRLKNLRVSQQSLPPPNVWPWKGGVEKKVSLDTSAESGISYLCLRGVHVGTVLTGKSEEYFNSGHSERLCLFQLNKVSSDTIDIFDSILLVSIVTWCEHNKIEMTAFLALLLHSSSAVVNRQQSTSRNSHFSYHFVAGGL